MFETIALVSTLIFVTIFVVLFQMNRAGRAESDKTDPPA